MGLKENLQNLLNELSDKYPNLLGLSDSNKIEVDKYNQKYNLSVGLNTLSSPQTSLSGLIDCANTILHTLKIVSNNTDRLIGDNRELSEIILKESSIQNLNSQIDEITNRHLRETQTILTERDNEKQDNIRLVKENKTLTDRNETFKDTYEQLWDKYLMFEKTFEIMKNNCKHDKSCLEAPKTTNEVIGGDLNV